MYLRIKINNNDNELKKYYNNIKLNLEDSGIDLIIPKKYKTSCLEQTTIDHEISCELIKNDKPIGFWLVPRSSISKTKFRMANCIGLIDSGYRGPIKAKIDTLPSYQLFDNEIIINNELNIIKKGTKLFQIVAPSLEPITKVIVVESLSNSSRGSGGFGSTSINV